MSATTTDRYVESLLRVLAVVLDILSKHLTRAQIENAVRLMLDKIEQEQEAQP